MKKIMKVLGYGLGAVALLVAAGLLYFNLKGIPDHAYNPPAEVLHLKVRPDSVRVARGEKIASMQCMACHANTTDGKLVGKPMGEIPKVFGSVHSLNLTRDSVHGIGAWTDGELYYFLRTGIHNDGRWSPPFMPKYSLMADEDIYSVIAWLRSDDPRLAPDSREYPPNQYNLFVKVLANTLFEPPPMPERPITIPDSTDRVAFGKYVGTALGHCYSCHSMDMLKVDELVPEHSVGYFGGGIPMQNQEGQIVMSANLTMDKETGIGNWTEQQFIEAVRFGKKPGGGTLAYPMAPHPMLSDNEVSAIYTYLKTVPVIKNQVQRYQAGI